MRLLPLPEAVIEGAAAEPIRPVWFPPDGVFAPSDVAEGVFAGRAAFPPIDGIVPVPYPGVLLVVPFVPKEPEPYPVAAGVNEVEEFRGAPCVIGPVETLRFLVLWVRPMPLSAFPCANDARVPGLQQLHPVNSMPTAHAPIRLAKGCLPIGLSSPRVKAFTPRPIPAYRDFDRRAGAGNARSCR